MKKMFMCMAAVVAAVSCGQQKGVVSEDGADVFMAGDKTVSIYCIKHGSFRMSVDDEWFYVDPVAAMVPPETDYSEMPKADYILVTHAHPDHLDTAAIQQLVKPGTLLITNQESAGILGGDYTCSVLANGDCIALSQTLSVSAVPAYNTSEDKQDFHPKGRDNGYVIDISGLRIYVAGDTEVIPEMADIKSVDIAFLPCNLPFTMTPKQCAEAAETVCPKVLFPYHYGNTEIGRVAELLEGSGIDVRIRQYQ